MIIICAKSIIIGTIIFNPSFKLISFGKKSSIWRFAANSKQNITAANSPPFQEPVRPRRKEYFRFTGREVVGFIFLPPLPRWSGFNSPFNRGSETATPNGQERRQSFQALNGFSKKRSANFQMKNRQAHLSA